MAATPWYQLVHATQKQRLGLRKTDQARNEYIYLKGVTSNAVGSWVSFNTTSYVAVLLAADAVGKVGVSMSTATGSQWGWFMISGFYASSKSDTVAAAGGLFIDGTPGRVDDQSVAGDFVFGAVSTAADATNILPVQLNYPWVGNTVPA